MTIHLKRAYEPPSADDGFRVLVERLWPRGITKERARIDLWIKDAGASTELRKWYAHDTTRWEEFRKRYVAELRQRPEVLRQLDEIRRTHDTVTFIFAARDTVHNNAVALKKFLEGET